METGPLAPGEPADTNYPVTALDPERQELVIDYSSLSRTRYRSRAIIEGRRWVREFSFTKLTGHEPGAKAQGRRPGTSERASSAIGDVR